VELFLGGLIGGLAASAGWAFEPLLGPFVAAAIQEQAEPSTPADIRTDGALPDASRERRPLPRFAIDGYEAEAQTLNRFIEQQAAAILPAGPLFDLEYRTLGDLWMDGLWDPGDGARPAQPVQPALSQALARLPQDADGYVQSGQHFSHAHDGGWPFPLWAQVGGGWQGRTAGWHFEERGPGWLWDFGFLRSEDPHTGAEATRAWRLEGLVSRGLDAGRWQLATSGPTARLTSPQGTRFQARLAPFVQVRWKLPEDLPEAARAFLWWTTEDDADFGTPRVMPLPFGAGSPNAVDGCHHTLVQLAGERGWEGAITGLRITLDGLPAGTPVELDSVFTCFDTRHPANAALFVLACSNVVRWTGDLAFLRAQIDRMRAAVELLDRAFHGAQLGFTRVTWPGHDGQRGWIRDADGRLTTHPGSGIGGNYFDLLPFGHDDAWLTAQYLGALEALAEIEALAEAYPRLGLLGGQRPGNSAALLERARQVRERGGRHFFDPEAGRFVACIDLGGVPHDYGYTFVNLDAVRFGLADALQRERILAWLFAEREVQGDTSVGADLYHWRFGLRTSTVRNVEWYAPVWTDPASQPFGGQIQDGGAVLGFTYFELMERLRWRGVDDAFERYREVLGWYREVEEAGGFRPYYASPRRAGTLQGCGTPGGLGLDCEFQEGRLIAAFAAHGLLGLQPDLQRLAIRPRFPEGCSRLALEGLQYRGVRLDVAARPERVELKIHDIPLGPLTFALDGTWKLEPGGATGSLFSLERPGNYVLSRVE
jgi:hypothetical protein